MRFGLFLLLKFRRKLWHSCVIFYLWCIHPVGRYSSYSSHDAVHQTQFYCLLIKCDIYILFSGLDTTQIKYSTNDLSASLRLRRTLKFRLFLVKFTKEFFPRSWTSSTSCCRCTKFIRHSQSVICRYSGIIASRDIWKHEIPHPYAQFRSQPEICHFGSFQYLKDSKYHLNNVK